MPDGAAAKEERKEGRGGGDMLEFVPAAMLGGATMLVSWRASEAMVGWVVVGWCWICVRKPYLCLKIKNNWSVYSPPTQFETADQITTERELHPCHPKTPNGC